MDHPLFDPTKYSNNELHEQLTALTKKYWATNNEHVQYQMTIIMDQIKEELTNRQIVEKNNQSTTEDLDNLINVS